MYIHIGHRIAFSLFLQTLAAICCSLKLPSVSVVPRERVWICCVPLLPKPSLISILAWFSHPLHCYPFLPIFLFLSRLSRWLAKYIESFPCKHDAFAILRGMFAICIRLQCTQSCLVCSPEIRNAFGVRLLISPISLHLMSHMCVGRHKCFCIFALWQYVHVLAHITKSILSPRMFSFFPRPRLIQHCMPVVDGLLHTSQSKCLSYVCCACGTCFP